MNYNSPISANDDPEEIFQIVELLGEGNYGKVYQAMHKPSGQMLAVKIVPSNGEIESLKKEIMILKDCQNNYIVRYYGSYYKDNCLWLVIEYCAAGSVIDLIKITKRQLNEYEIASILQQSLKGLEYLHNNKKIHRDIKAGNILLDTEGNVKLADFGVSAQLQDTFACKDSVIGTPFWMSPEVIKNSQYNSKTDIWSLGITAIELAEGQPPYSNIHYIRAMHSIVNKPPVGLSEPSKWSKEFNDFVRSCLQYNPDQRPTAKELLQHSFLVKKAKGKALLNELVSNSLNAIEKYRQQKNKKQKYEQQNEDNDSNQEENDDDQGELSAYQTMIERKKGNQNQDTTNIKAEESSLADSNIFYQKELQSEKQINQSFENDDINNSVNYVSTLVVKAEDSQEQINQAEKHVPDFVKYTQIMEDVGYQPNLQYIQLPDNKIQKQQELSQKIELQIKQQQQLLQQQQQQQNFPNNQEKKCQVLEITLNNNDNDNNSQQANNQKEIQIKQQQQQQQQINKQQQISNKNSNQDNLSIDMLTKKKVDLQKEMEQKIAKITQEYQQQINLCEKTILYLKAKSDLHTLSTDESQYKKHTSNLKSQQVNVNKSSKTSSTDSDISNNILRQPKFNKPMFNNNINNEDNGIQQSNFNNSNLESQDNNSKPIVRNLNQIDFESINSQQKHKCNSEKDSVQSDEVIFQKMAQLPFNFQVGDNNNQYMQSNQRQKYPLQSTPCMPVNVQQQKKNLPFEFIPNVKPKSQQEMAGTGEYSEK